MVLMALRRTVQFSVKSLLVLVGCAAVVFAIVHHELRLRAGTEWALRRSTHVYDATLFDYDNRLDRSLIWLRRLVGSRILAGISMTVTSGDDISFISRCKYLRYVELTTFEEECDVNAVLSEVTRCRRVCELRLVGFQVDDFSVLGSMESLDTLDVRGIRSSNWEWIAKLQNLELVVTSARIGLTRSRPNERRRNCIQLSFDCYPTSASLPRDGYFLSGHLIEEHPTIPRPGW